MHQARLTSARMLSPSVRELTFDAGSEFRFVAGQWVSLRVPVENGEELSRAYSIASAPRDDGRFDIAVTRVEQGPGSRKLHEVQPGEAFRMSHAQGFFTLEPVVRPVLMVGTGTGVSPLRSMLVAASRDEDVRHERFVLLFGCRSEEDMLYRDDFERLEREWPSFRFVPTLSRAGANWKARCGYVQLHVPEIVANLGGHCDVYVCGLNRMIREVRTVLKEKLGFTRERIHTERYD
jgi:CDP-4-dehydro-6-deoxyglucose reductase